MFRPARERSLLGYVPLRLAISVFVLFALLLAVAVVVGMQYERHVLLSSGGMATGAGATGSIARGLAWKDLLKVLAALLLLAAVAILLFTTFQNYRAVTQTFERVKSLMRNVLQSIPTGVLTLDARGVVTSLNKTLSEITPHRERAARILGISPRALHYKLRRYRIE